MWSKSVGWVEDAGRKSQPCFGVQQELNVLKAKVESWEAFAPPGIAWTKNYAIHAHKRWDNSGRENREEDPKDARH
jgi:hypothetical protein